MTKKWILLVFALVLAVLTGCKKSSKNQYDQVKKTTSFRDIPGITQSEINAIEAFKKNKVSFVYGMTPSTEAFTGKDGEIHGYSALFCDWLTELFGIPFKTKFYNWGDLIKGLENGEIDFTGELMTTPERRKSFFMTSPVAERSLKIFRIRDRAPLNEILWVKRKPRYAFLEGSILNVDVVANAGYNFETIFIDDYNTAYRMLKSGEIDAYFGMDTSDAAFAEFGDVVTEDFYPLTFKSACLSAKREELEPLINVVEKALNKRTLDYLAGLYQEGHKQYLGKKLNDMLTEEERTFIQNNPVIPIAAEADNYPICFFDANTNQWDGIFCDTLDEITKLIGLKFERVNDQKAPNSDLITMLENGKALIMPELYHLKEYKGRFLWSEFPLVEDTFAFLSKSDYRDIEISRIPNIVIGVRRNSIYSEFFNMMFPEHRYLKEYDTQEEVWNALKRDEVEIIFACNRRLITYTNFYEEAGYKLNLILNYSFDSSIGYNKNAAVLKSIVDKALSIININNIANQWMHKSYDYRQKLTEAQRPWFIGAAFLFLLILVFTLYFLKKSRSFGKQLETVVRHRTSELSFKTSQLQMMIDSIPDLMFCKDNDLKYTQCNKLFENFIGVKEAELIGKTDADGSWLSIDSEKRISNIEKSVLKDKSVVKYEEYVSSPLSGKGCYFETIKAPLIKDGAVVGMMGIARDISGRKTMEKEIELQSSLLNTIINSLPDGVFCKNMHLKYTLCNKYMADLFGKKMYEILGFDDMQAFGFSPETAAIANAADRKAMNERCQVSFEEKLKCADGVERFFETVKVPLILDGEIVGILGIGRDITQRKAMEDEVRAASIAKSDFLANMSHEIRTPLNVIIGLTGLVLEDDSLSKSVTDNLIKINNAGSTLLSIVNDILDFSKIESGKLKISPVEYYMSSLLNDVITLVVTRLGEKPIKFNLNIPDDLPAKLYGDDLRVKQILTNLLSNSAKYTHRGSIDLKVDCKREDKVIWMYISVSDTGIGIRTDDVKKLFLDYFQVDAKANRNIEGTGLGLPITKRLVEMMDGEIDAESEYGKGTTFSLRIKQGYVEDTPLGADVAEKLRSFRYTDDKRIANKRLVRLNLSYVKVLVVDDMQTNLDVAAGLLRKYKMQVDCIDNGLEAVERIRAGTPVYDAIFMDHMMPGMDGIETADRIRALGAEYAKKVPIIALTANAIQGTEKMFYEHDFQAFISKPIDIMELDSVIRKWVRNEEKEKELGTNTYLTPDSSSEDENSANLAIKIPGVDTDKGISLYGGDTKIYLALLHSYVANTPGNLSKLRTVSKETLPDYVIAVHGLKGTSAGIGAEEIRAEALNLENLSRAGDIDKVLALNDKLIKDAEIVVESVKTWLEQYDALNAKPRLKAPDLEVLSRLRQCCETYDMAGIDKAMSELESTDYEEGADLVKWLKKKIVISEITEAAARIAQYVKEFKK
jgi:PAS domain S-box-containing protein